MRRTLWAACLWPALPQIWGYGSWVGLSVAVAAAALLNVALLATVVWSELLAPDMRKALWVGIGATWIGSAIWSVVCGEPSRRPKSAKDWFEQALHHYLKGNWIQAERLLGTLLRKNARDVEARLMLATLLRHTGRHDEATGQLDWLERFEAARKWHLEIRRERQLIVSAGANAEQEVQQDSTSGDNDRATIVKSAA